MIKPKFKSPSVNWTNEYKPKDNGCAADERTQKRFKERQKKYSNVENTKGLHVKKK
jgi:hypothetical protein